MAWLNVEIEWDCPQYYLGDENWLNAYNVEVALNKYFFKRSINPISVRVTKDDKLERIKKEIEVTPGGFLDTINAIEKILAEE